MQCSGPLFHRTSCPIVFGKRSKRAALTWYMHRVWLFSLPRGYSIWCMYRTFLYCRTTASILAASCSRVNWYSSALFVTYYGTQVNPTPSLVARCTTSLHRILLCGACTMQETHQTPVQMATSPESMIFLYTPSLSYPCGAGERAKGSRALPFFGR